MHLSMVSSSLDIVVCWVINYSYFNIGSVGKWFDSETPYLVEDTPITPHITGCGVFLVINSLRGRPLDWNLPSL